MATMDQTLASQRWDAEYRKGRYVAEPPVPFVGHILTTLQHAPSLRHGIGLYIGCGNGRNYLPLVHAGLHLYGLDLSPESLRQLAKRDSTRTSRLLCPDFRTFGSARRGGKRALEIPRLLGLIGRSRREFGSRHGTACFIEEHEIRKCSSDINADNAHRVAFLVSSTAIQPQCLLRLHDWCAR